jgi:hypothetical protein
MLSENGERGMSVLKEAWADVSLERNVLRKARKKMGFEGSSGMLCTACGAPVAEGNRFCGACGQAVSVFAERGPEEGRKASVSDAKKKGRGIWAVLGGGFVFALIFFVAGSIPAFMDLPGFLAHFTGVQTTGLATAIGDCGDSDSSGDYYAYTFTDRQGVIHKIENTSVCSSGIVSDGERVTIWYNPNNPSQFITQNDFNFAMIFVVGFSIPMDIWVVMTLVMVVRVVVRRGAGGKGTVQRSMRIG